MGIELYQAGYNVGYIENLNSYVLIKHPISSIKNFEKVHYSINACFVVEKSICFNREVAFDTWLRTVDYETRHNVTFY